MNVFDPRYEFGMPLCQPNEALFEAIEYACQLLRCDSPRTVLTVMKVQRAGRELYAVDLVDVGQQCNQLPTWRAYAEKSGNMVSALQNLAIYGCRGNELAFACNLSEDARFWHWVLIDPVSLMPKNIRGTEVRSSDYFFVETTQ